MSHKIASLGFEVLPEVLMLEEESGTSEPEPKVANCHQRGHLAWQRESPWTKIGGGRMIRLKKGKNGGDCDRCMLPLLPVMLLPLGFPLNVLPPTGEVHLCLPSLDQPFFPFTFPTVLHF